MTKYNIHKTDENNMYDDSGFISLRLSDAYICTME